MGVNITQKQQRIDELIRDNTRFKLRTVNKKCGYCNDGEKIPEKVEMRIKKEKEEKEKKEKFKKMQQQNMLNQSFNNNGRKGDSSEEETDPKILARIKELEQGKKGFTSAEMAKVKYMDNIDEIANYGNKEVIQKAEKQDQTSDSTQDTTVVVAGPRDTSCPCCESEVRAGDKFMFLKCCKSIYHQKCIGVWLMCQKFCPNKNCRQIINIKNYF